MLARIVLQARLAADPERNTGSGSPCTAAKRVKYAPREGLALRGGTGTPLAEGKARRIKATWEEPNAAVYRAVERRLARDVSGGDQPLSVAHRRRGAASGSPLREERRSRCCP